MARVWWRLLGGVCGLVALACGGESVRHHAGSSGGESGAAATAHGGGPSAAGGGGGSGTATLGGSAGAGGTSTVLIPDFDPTPEPDAAVTYQIDPAHSGAQLASRYLGPPLHLGWTSRYAGAVSYPLIVDWRIFFTSNDAGYRIPTVRAIDPRTAEEVWQVTPFGTGSDATSAHLAYDRGLIFAVDGTGHVAAFDAETGATAWSITLDMRYQLSVPVAVGGVVFVSGSTADGPQLYALSEKDGSVHYRVPAQVGHPTLGGGNVYTTSACYETRAVAASTGEELWHYRGSCIGGGGEQTSYWNGYLFASSPQGAVGALDVASGSLFAELDGPSRVWPMSFGKTPLAFEAFEGISPDDSQGLVAYDASLTTKTRLPVSTAAGWPRLPMIATPRYVYALLGPEPHDPATLVALDVQTGELQAMEDAFPGDPDWNDLGGNPLPGMAAGSERFVVVGMRRTVAVYESLIIR